MKRILNIFLGLLLLISLFACGNERKIYKNGDEVIIDGVVYEFNIPDYFLNEIDYNHDPIPVYDYENPTDALYHSAYYIDMLHPESYPKIPSDINNVEYDSIFDSANIKYENGVINSTAYAYRTNDLTKNWFPGFWIKGYTEEIENDVVIPNDIDNLPIIGIGYNALNGLKINSLTFSEPTRIILKDNIEPKINIRYEALTINELSIMPYAFKDAHIIEINIDRKTFIYQRAFESMSTQHLNFYDNEIQMLDAAINDSEINLLTLDTISKDYNPEVNSYFTGMQGFINPLICNSDVQSLKSQVKGGYDIFKLRGQLYVGESKIRGIYPISTYRGNVSKSLLYILPTTNIVRGFNIRNNKLDAFFTQDEYLKTVKTIVIDFNDDLNAHKNYYLEGKTLFYKYNEYKIEFITAPDGCDIVLIN